MSRLGKAAVTTPGFEQGRRSAKLSEGALDSTSPVLAEKSADIVPVALLRALCGASYS